MTRTDESPAISAVVLCRDEALNIRDCLESVKGFCEIFVVDSGSTDDTVAICRQYTDRVFFHEYRNHSTQWQWVLENLPLDTDWVLALDADFVVEDSLKREIRERLDSLPDDVDGVYVRHRYVFGGGRIRFGGTKQYWLRIVRCGRARADASDLVDFRFYVPGRTLRFAGSVVEYNRNDDDISTWLKKQDRFAIRLAVEEELRRASMLDWEKPPRFFGNSDERIMWLRDKWLSLPLFVRPLVYFLYRYVLMLGFLDGRAGFLYHALQGWWLRTIVDWKICQIRSLGLRREELAARRDQMLAVTDGSVTSMVPSMRTGARR